MAATAEKYYKYKSIDQLPALFPVKVLAEIMGINITAAYELVKRQDFNCSITIGSKIMIVKEHYKKWLDNTVLCEKFVNGYKELTDDEKELYETVYWEAVRFLKKQEGVNHERNEKVKSIFR